MAGILGNSLPLCQRQHEKRNIYNLNEDEELTHYGQSLADIEKLNDIVDSDSDAEERGTLSGKGRSSSAVCSSLAWPPGLLAALERVG